MALQDIANSLVSENNDESLTEQNYNSDYWDEQDGTHFNLEEATVTAQAVKETKKNNGLGLLLFALILWFVCRKKKKNK